MQSTERAGRVTLAQVAARAGVSPMTASYTFGRPGRVSEQTRARVLAAAAELGYSGPDPAARSLRRGRTMALGVVLGEHLSYAFDDAGAVAFLAGVAEVCTERGVGLTLVPVTGGPDDVPRVREAAVDAFVVWTTSDDDPVLEAVSGTGRPAVVHGGPAVDGLGLVGADDEAAARAVGAVVFAGAARPAVVSQPLDRAREARVVRGPRPDDALYPVTRHRLAGYRRAVTDLRGDWGQVPVAVCARNSVEDGERAAARLLAAPEPPDAIAAMSDQMAAGVVRAVRVAGLRVPDDLAVSGWDDGPTAAEHGLTTVRQSLREQGARCARAAVDGDRGRHPAPWSVVVRASTR